MQKNTDDLANVQFLGSISAGFPSPVDEWKDPPLNLHEYVVKHPISTYFMRVSGDSMVGACIYPDDVIVVDRALTAMHKKIVVARVGNGYTLKRLLTSKGRIVLKPENPAHEPIEVTGRDDWEIWGVVTFCIHKVS
ncbi:MAG: translesion error-prone DNA polymerase V autoproteolytic subunit [Ktedonobacteraceae bacterium]